MNISVIHDPGEDFGTLVVRLEKDDMITLSGFGNEMALKLPLYSHEAKRVRELLLPVEEDARS